MAEQPQSSFAMSRSRTAIAQGLHHIESRVDTIESAVSENPGLAFDLAKAIVESTCRTILSERSVSYDHRDDLPRLFRAVKENLPLLPVGESHEASVRESIQRTLGGLTSAIHGISELRNQLSFASHGSDKPRPSMETVHAILVAQAADTIIGFLYEVHIRGRNPSTDPMRPLNRDSEFDKFVDDNHEVVRIFQLEFPASDILFEMEPDSYRIHRSDFVDRTDHSEAEA